MLTCSAYKFALESKYCSTVNTEKSQRVVMGHELSFGRRIAKDNTKPGMITLPQKSEALI